MRARTAPGYGPNSTEVIVNLQDPGTYVHSSYYLLSRDLISYLHCPPGALTGEQSGGVGGTGIALILLGIGWLILVAIIVLVVAAYFWRRKRKFGTLTIL